MNLSQESNDERSDKQNGGASHPEVQPIRFAGSVLNTKRHICGFFRTPDEEYELLLPFIKEGFDLGEKAFHVVNPILREDHLNRLKAAGIDTTSTEQTGQLQLCDWDEVYFPDGRFDQERMLGTWQDVLGNAGECGFPGTRLVAHMDWALEDREGVSDLLEYESRFNLLHAEHRDPVICVYDLTKFSADVIMYTLRTHPMVIVGGLLQENPLYTPPQQFLQELRERRTSQGESPSTAH
jgi:hypothetical protein